MPVRSMPASTCSQRQLDVAQQRGAAGRLELLGERRREVEDGAGPHHRVLPPRRPVVAEVEQCPGRSSSVSAAQLATEVAQHEVGQVVGALVGPDEVGRERGVGRRARERPAPRREREQRALGVVQHLGPRPGRRARRDRGVAVRVQLRRRRRMPRRRRRSRPAPARWRRRCRGPSCRRRARRRAAPAGACSASQPGRPRPARGRRRRGRSRRSASSSAARGTRRAGRAAPGTRGCRRRCGPASRSQLLPLEVVDGDAQRRGRVTSWLSRRLRSTPSRCSRSDVAGLALDLVDVGDEPAEVAVLRRSTWPRSWARRPGRPAGCRWSRRPGRRGRGSAPAARRSFSSTASGVIRAQLGDALARVEHGDLVVDQLEGVAVAGADQDVDALASAPGWSGSR